MARMITASQNVFTARIIAASSARTYQVRAHISLLVLHGGFDSNCLTASSMTTFVLRWACWARFEQNLVRSCLYMYFWVHLCRPLCSLRPSFIPYFIRSLCRCFSLVVLSFLSCCSRPCFCASFFLSFFRCCVLFFVRVVVSLFLGVFGSCLIYVFTSFVIDLSVVISFFLSLFRSAMP